MSDDERPKSGSERRQDREAKLARALRANLRKRKKRVAANARGEATRGRGESGRDDQ